jgi:hypothetical protein
MSIRLFRHDGFPLIEVPELKVYRHGSFQTVTTPAIGDIFSLESDDEVVTYSVFKVNGLNNATLLRIYGYVRSKKQNQSFS